jgi:hypothetical protein
MVSVVSKTGVFDSEALSPSRKTIHYTSPEGEIRILDADGPMDEDLANRLGFNVSEFYLINDPLANDRFRSRIPFSTHQERMRGTMILRLRIRLRLTYLRPTRHCSTD